MSVSDLILHLCVCAHQFVIACMRPGNPWYVHVTSPTLMPVNSAVMHCFEFDQSCCCLEQVKRNHAGLSDQLLRVVRALDALEGRFAEQSHHHNSKTHHIHETLARDLGQLECVMAPNSAGDLLLIESCSCNMPDESVAGCAMSAFNGPQCCKGSCKCALWMIFLCSCLLIADDTVCIVLSVQLVF